MPDRVSLSPRVAAFVAALLFTLPFPAAAQPTASVSLSAQQQAATGPAGTARVTVRVVADDDGAPVKRTRLSLQASIFPSRSWGAPAGQAERVRRDGVTNDAGVVTFASLPEAPNYVVVPTPPTGFVRPSHLESFPLAEGAAVTRILRLTRTGALAGRLLDESGEPLVRVSVRALQKEAGNGRPRLAGLGEGGQTDDRGQFRIFGLPPGDYYLLALSPFVAAVPDRQGGTTYLPTLYPAATTVERAEAVAVMPGRDTAVPDFALLNGGVCRVAVHALSSSGEPLSNPSARVTLVPKRRELSEAVRGGSVGRDGLFTIAGVPPGDYYLTAWNLPPGGEEEGVVIPVSVSDEESFVEVRTNRGATLSGRIVREGPEGPGGPVRLLLVSAPGGMTAFPDTVHRRPDVEHSQEGGEFHVTGARGAVVLVASGPGVLRSVRTGGREMLGVPFELSGSERIADLEVVVTTSVGSVSGSVTDANGEVVEAEVFAFPENPRAWSSLFLRYTRSAGQAVVRTAALGPGLQPDRRPGQFTLHPLAPGRYLVAGRRWVPNGSPMPDTDGLARLAPSATLVTVGPGETVNVDLKVR